jgi:hypothetical protein
MTSLLWPAIGLALSRAEVALVLLATLWLCCALLKH